MKRAKNLLLAAGLLASCLVSVCVPSPAHAEQQPKVYISELQVGTSTDNFDEFIELYNADESPVDVSGWTVEFYSSSKKFPTPTDTFAYPTPTRTLQIMQGALDVQSYDLLAAPNHYADKTTHFFEGSSASSGYLPQAGYVRIANSAGITVDFLAWGSGTKQVDSWMRFTSMPDGQSVQRNFYTNEPYAYNEPGALTTPGLPLPPPPTEDQPHCDGLVLSEILPNAAGSDSGHEFIELYNPTSSQISMLGCALRLGDTGAQFNLPDEPLDPGAYRAFYDSETGITLPNQTAETVWLLTNTTEQGILYGNDLDDDQSWALFGANWHATYTPTPSQPNQLLEQLPVVPVSCPAGQERNSDTNRCRTITLASVTLAACKPGQERNPATNRCRSMATPTTGLVACKAGQERNPATNRCRSVLGATTNLKPCAPNQERNADTNRCRKMATNDATGKLAKIQEAKTSFKPDNPKWLLAVGAMVLVLGYGIYEWRQEIVRSLKRFIHRDKVS